MVGLVHVIFSLRSVTVDGDIIRSQIQGVGVDEDRDERDWGVAVFFCPYYSNARSASFVVSQGMERRQD